MSLSEADAPVADAGPVVTMVVADDHPIVRAGLVTVLAAQPGFHVVGEASDGPQTVALVLQHQPRVALVDIAMPLLSGVAVTERIVALAPATQVLAVSTYSDAGHVRRMLAAGARGYFAKRSPVDDLVRAVRIVARGDIYIDPLVAPALVGEPYATPGTTALSEREVTVMRRYARGQSMKEIAAALDVSVRTVETYRGRAMQKLALQSREDVVQYAAEHGWLDDT